VVEKAICWLQTAGYTLDLDFETILLSTALFYACLNGLTLPKQALHPTRTRVLLSLRLSAAGL
jgi:hypothetical protein